MCKVSYFLHKVHNFLFFASYAALLLGEALAIVIWYVDTEWQIT